MSLVSAGYQAFKEPHFVETVSPLDGRDGSSLVVGVERGQRPEE
jgi:hypothetical protein